MKTKFETKDSGSRVKYVTGMIRDSQKGKPRYDLVYEPLLTEWAHLMARGIEKYGDEMEEWRQTHIPNVEVSNFGNVKKNGRLISQWTNKWGYKLVTLASKGKKHHQVHRLVAKAFIGDSNLQVNHIDFDKGNNRIDNLEYLSAKDNIKHSLKAGRIIRSQAYGKINFAIAQEIRKRVNSGEQSMSLSKEFKISPQTVCDIVKFRIWKEDNSIKRDENSENWKKSCTVAELKRFKASAWRHFVQFIRGDDDEAHHAAVCFNIAAIMRLMDKLNVDINGEPLEQHEAI